LSDIRALLSGNDGLNNAGVLLLVNTRALNNVLIVNNVRVNDSTGDGNLMVLDIVVSAGNNGGSNLVDGVLTTDGVGTRDLDGVLFTNDAGNLDGDLARLSVSIRNLDHLLDHDGLGNKDLLIAETDTGNVDGLLSIVKDGAGNSDLVVLDSDANLGDGDSSGNRVDVGNSVCQSAGNRHGAGLNVSAGHVDGSGGRHSVSLQNNGARNVSVVLNEGRAGESSGDGSSVGRNCGLNLLLLSLRLSCDGH